MSHPLTALVFDLDGTLYVDRELAREIHLVACRFMAAELGVTPEEADRLIREAKAGLARETGLESTLSAACQQLGGDLASLHRHFAEEVDPTPFLTRDERIIGLLTRLGQRYGLYLYTNNNRPLSERILTVIGAAGLFRGIFSIEDYWRPKPDSLALARVLAEIGVPPAATLFVGDRYDIDLRLPKSMGSRVYLSQSLDELLALERVLLEEQI